mgnify:FL=1
MADTAFGLLTSMQKKVWLLKVRVQGRHRQFWGSNGFISDNSGDTNTPVTRVTELTETERGTEAVMPLVPDLSVDSGTVSDNLMEGNEEALTADSQTIRIDQLRHAVRSRGAFSEQETVIRFRATAQEKLAFWLADVKDELQFLMIAGRAFTLNTNGSTRGASQLPQLRFASDVVAASTNRIMHAGAATSEATLTTSDIMNWDLIVRAKAFAKRKALAPIRLGGREYYAIVMSTEQCRDLSQSADYKSLVSQAMPRGADNPLFTNAKRVVEDTIVYDHQKVFNTLGLASSSRWGATGTVHGAQAILLGAQALGICELTKGSRMVENSMRDYENRPGLGIRNIFGTLKPQFKSKYDSNTTEDYGTVAIKTAAAASS